MPTVHGLCRRDSCPKRDRYIIISSRKVGNVERYYPSILGKLSLSDPHVDGVFGPYRRRLPGVQAALVAAAVGVLEVVVEGDRAVLLGLGLDAELQEGGGPARVLLGQRVQVDEEGLPPLAAAEDLAHVARVEEVVVPLVLLAGRVLQELERLDVRLGVPGEERDPLPHAPG